MSTQIIGVSRVARLRLVYAPLVKVLIYVFDVESSDVAGDLERYRGVLDAVEHNSPDARYTHPKVVWN